MYEIETYLRENGSKATPQRVAILSVLKKEAKPLSISKISERLLLKINQTTLYRALDALTELGVVKKIELGHTHTHYEFTLGLPHHHHLICETCGKIEDVNNCETKNLEKNVLKHSSSFQSIKSHALEFFGTCDNCLT